MFRLSLFLCFAFLISSAAFAQNVDPKVMAHAKNVAKSCLSNWESAKCIQAMGQSNKDLAINYAEKLNAQNKKQAIESIKNGCAAATVDEKAEFPSSAFASAYNECINTVYDTTTKTGILPDQSHYQLLVAGGLCLNKDQRCAMFEGQMQQWR